VAPENLQRFLWAQEGVLEQVQEELRAGRKTSHWMWFIFPQLAGLGRSATAQRYALASLDDARAFLAHPELGSRLRTCCSLLLCHRDRPVEQLLGPIDALKLRSSMTLFLQASGEPLFRQVLDAFYEGREDSLTLDLLAQH
jgi:uncharacterized protein (DUF1810 family)